METGLSPARAAGAVVMIDGLVLDALIRGRHGIDVHAAERVLRTDAEW